MASSENRNRNLDSDINGITVQLGSIEDVKQIKGVKFAHLNIRSVLNKISDLHIMLLQSKIDILVISETFLTGKIENSEISIPNYYMIRADRTRASGKTMGGGLLVYIRNDRIVELVDNSVICNASLEALWIKMSLRDTRPIYIGAFYRPPQGDQSVYLDWIEQSSICIGNDRVSDQILIGDANIDFNNRRVSRNYRMILKNNSLCQLINLHTRVTCETMTTIDHVLVNNPILYTQHAVLETGISDHSMIIVGRKKCTKSKRSTFVYFKDFAHADYENINEQIQTHDWSEFFTNRDLNSVTEYFHSTVEKIIDQNIPLKRHRVSENWPKWLNGEYLDLIKERQKLNKEFKKNNTEENRIAKTDIEKQCKRLKKRLQRQYIEETLAEHEGNSKKLWETINYFWGRKKGDSEILKIAGTTDKQEIAEKLNMFFSKIGQDLAEKIQHDVIDPIYNFPYNLKNTMTLRNIDIKDIEDIINQSSPNKAGRDDGLPIKIIKLCSTTLAPLITYIFNLSISTGEFPSYWKTAVIVPLYKEGNRSQESNYRPISLLSPISKLLEKVIHLQMSTYFESHGLLCREQSGFREGCSTGTCLLDFLDRIYLNIEQGRTSGVLFLDLKKAFDTVDHGILLQKLACYGVDDVCRMWFESYLRDRSCQVRVNGVTSSKQNILYGVPQGSILGPLLFTIYVNDISYFVQGPSIGLYADDTSILESDISVENLQLKLENSLKSASNWLRRNKLSLNLKKTKVMVFGTRSQIRKTQLNVQLYNEEIEKVDSFKYLGVILDSALTYSLHAEYIRSRTMGRVGVLGRLRGILNTNMSLMLYKLLILPIFDYCDIVYDSLGTADSRKLQIVQNKALRIITGKNIYTRISELHSQVNLPGLGCRREYHTLIHVNKILTGECHKQYTPLCSYASPTHNYETRLSDQNLLTVWYPKTKQAEGSFRYRGPKLWNRYTRQYEGFTSGKKEDFKDKLKLFLHFK